MPRLYKKGTIIIIKMPKEFKIGDKVLLSIKKHLDKTY